MAFRMILVGVVASLGFDLPTGRDVEDWTGTGRAWFEARVSEFQARQELAGGAGDLVPEPSTGEPVGSDADRTFAAVVEEMVSAFAAHGAMSAPTLEEHPVPVAGDTGAFGNELAEALNRFADGLSEPAEPAPIPVPVSVPVAAEAAGRSIASLDRAERGSIPTQVAEISVDLSKAGSHLDQVSRAVQLTSQALQAWMSVLQPGLTATVLAE